MAEKAPKHTSSNKKHKHSDVKFNDWPGGWFTVKRSIVDFFTNIVPWLVGLLAVVPLIMAAVIQAVINAKGVGSNIYLNIAMVALIFIGGMAAIYVFVCMLSSTPIYGLARASGKRMSTKEFYTVRWNIFWRILGVELLLGLAIIAGLLLFIIPGIVLAIWILPASVLVPYIIVEEDMGVIDSLKRAYELGKGHEGKVWGIVGWYFLILLILLIPIALLLFAAYSNDSHSMANRLSNKNDSYNNSSSGGASGGGPLTAISFAYLYNWIKYQS